MKAKLSEDWLAVVVGLFVFGLSLGAFAGADALGWAVSTSVWTSLSKALAPASKQYAGLTGVVSLLATYVFMLAVMTLGARLLHADVARFAKGFTFVFFAAYVSWIIGSWAYIA